MPLFGATKKWQSGAIAVTQLNSMCAIVGIEIICLYKWYILYICRSTVCYSAYTVLSVCLVRVTEVTGLLRKSMLVSNRDISLHLTYIYFIL
jgi:hypothetical protein